jgi:formylmethanofuran dehydrogenase subunit B
MTGYSPVAEFGPVTCAGCGLLCDDVAFEGSGDGVRLRPACSLGARWFSQRIHRSGHAPAAINGRPTDADAALSRAAELLRSARRPLVHGFDGATVEDARAAVALADRLGALVATGGLADTWSGAPAGPERGASSATLGEIRDRSGVVVIWREDSETTHPRLLERLGFREGAFSRSPGQRVLVVVEDRETATAGRADLRLRWSPERDLEALVALHALQRGLGLPSDDLVAELSGLMGSLRAVPHAAFFYGSGLAAGTGGERRVLALHELVRALCHERHVVTLELARAPGTRSANDVLAWQTGYAANLDLAGGHPELVTGTAPLVEHQGVDVALCVEGAPARLPAGVAEIRLGGSPQASGEGGPDVSIRTAAAGVEASGTVHRLDGVPLALQAPLAADAPTAAALLTRLLAEVQR